MNALKHRKASRQHQTFLLKILQKNKKGEGKNSRLLPRACQHPKSASSLRKRRRWVPARRKSHCVVSRRRSRSSPPSLSSSPRCPWTLGPSRAPAPTSPSSSAASASPSSSPRWTTSPRHASLYSPSPPTGSVRLSLFGMVSSSV